MRRGYTNPIIRLLTQILLFSIIKVKNKVEATSNSVCNQPGIYSIRPCAQVCIGCFEAHGDQIAYMIGCGNAPPNECWCATNLFTVATTALRNCVSKSCTIGGWESDYIAAEQFYTSYCEVAGFTGIRGPDEGGGGEVVATTVQAAEGSTETRTTGTTANSNEPPKRTGVGGGGEVGGDGTVTEGQSGLRLSSSDRIALGVGIGLGLPATFAGVVTCVIQLRARSRRMIEGLPGGTVR